MGPVAVMMTARWVWDCGALPTMTAGLVLGPQSGNGRRSRAQALRLTRMRSRVGLVGLELGELTIGGVLLTTWPAKSSRLQHVRISDEAPAYAAGFSGYFDATGRLSQTTATVGAMPKRFQRPSSNPPSTRSSVGGSWRSDKFAGPCDSTKNGERRWRAGIPA